MSRQTQSYDDKAIRGEELESLATSIAQKIVDNGQVVADALDELDARTRALENRNPDVLGDAVADSLDTQVLKIGGQPIDTSAFEQVSNKVSSWQTTPDNTHYPSEKLVKTALDTWTASCVKPDSLVSAYVDLSFSGVSWSDFAGTGTNSLFAKIPWDSNSSKSAHIYGRITGKPNDWESHVGTNGTTAYGLFVAHKSRDSYFVDVYPNEKDNPNTSGTAVVLFELNSSSGIVTISKRVTARGADAIGSASVPVFVNGAGMVRPCTDDFVHDADIAKMVQVETAGTAAGSSLQPVYVNTSGVATPIDYKKWISERRDVLNALPSDWYKSEGSISIPSGNTVKYVELSGLNSIGGMDLWVMCNATNSPCMIRARFNLFRYGRSGIQILDRSGYDNANIGSIIIRTDSNAAGNPNFDNVKIYFRILNSSDVFAWRCSEARTNSHFAVLTEAQYNALTSVEACSANCTRFGATSTSSRHIQRGSYDVLDTGDVAQTYSSSSTAPISGKGVKAAVDSLSSTQIPIGLKYDMVLANETSTTPTLCYEISNIGLTSNYSAATAELVVYQYAAQGTSYTNIPSYKVVVHWDRTGAICIVEGLNPTGTWTAVVENSTTPSSTDVTTLKLYFKPAQYRTYRMSVVSCKLRGISRESYITDGKIVVKKVTQEIPTASTLVIVGTTTVMTLICDKNVTSTYSATGTDPVNGTAVASAISTKQDTLSFMTTAEATSLWQSAWAAAN